MATPLHQKSTVEEIRDRFDQDVERFSQLETGQVATIDAPLAMTLITNAAVAATSSIKQVLDIGCGAGNNTIMLRQALGHDFNADLLDISQPMIHRAVERLSAVNQGTINPINGDFRTVDLAPASYDVVLAAAVLHHLRDDADWVATFEKIYRILAPGGSVWITDLISHESRAVRDLMWTRYGDYLVDLDGEDYRDKVFSYIDKEDSPRPVTYQLELLRQVGFQHVELLHKNSCFAAFGAIKKPDSCHD
ncbi:MAG: class I SAM-dependent methyltransferase [Thermosynechococcaceae cyanobacterium]